MNSGDQSFLVRLDDGLQSVVNLGAGVVRDEAIKSGVSQAEWIRQACMEIWLKPPEEWELYRPIAWTPSDGIRLDTWRQLVERRMLRNLDYRIVLSAGDSARTEDELTRFEVACARTHYVDEWLMVRPMPLRWFWIYEDGWVLHYRQDLDTAPYEDHTESIDARVPYDDAGIDAIAADVARQILSTR